MSCEKERWWHQLKSSSCSHTSNQCQCKHLSQELIHLHFSARLIAAQWFKQRQNPSPRLWNVPCRTGHMDLLRAVTRRERQVVGGHFPDVNGHRLWCGCRSSADSPQLCRSRNLILSGSLELTDHPRTNSHQPTHGRRRYELKWQKEHVGVTSRILAERVRKLIQTTVLFGKHWTEVRMGEDKWIFFYNIF